MQEELKAAGAGSGVTWVAPENIHLTLKFCGEVTNEDVPEAGEIISSCLEGFRPFQLSVRGIGAFPNPERPRVVFAEAVDEPSVLKEIYTKLNGELGRVGVKREKRGFRSHVTIGRVRRPGVRLALGAEMLNQDFGTMEVSEVVFMMSELTPKGPIYSPVQKFSLG